MLQNLMRAVIFILTLGHPERASSHKIGNRKSDAVVYGAIALIALAAILYVVIKKP